ncbi:MAG: HAD family hydrolase [Anaerolineaceae bacterium]
MTALPNPSAAAVRAVLFDVGGPIDTELIAEEANDFAIRAALEVDRVTVTDEAYAAANAYAVESFAPDAYASIIWRLANNDAELARRAYARFHSADRLSARGGIELRPGIAELIAALHARGLLLGLAANQPLRILPELDRHRIGRYFAHREVSGHHGYRKPDVRLFLRACEDLHVDPAECIMVGDRIDNDIAPANVLGMRTILFRTGRHIAQQPRSVDELPDAEVNTVEALSAALLAITVI